MSFLHNVLVCVIIFSQKIKRQKEESARIIIGYMSDNYHDNCQENILSILNPVYEQVDRQEVHR